MCATSWEKAERKAYYGIKLSLDICSIACQIYYLYLKELSMKWTFDSMLCRYVSIHLLGDDVRPRDRLTLCEVMVYSRWGATTPPSGKNIDWWVSYQGAAPDLLTTVAPPGVFGRNDRVWERISESDCLRIACRGSGRTVIYDHYKDLFTHDIRFKAFFVLFTASNEWKFRKTDPKLIVSNNIRFLWTYHDLAKSIIYKIVRIRRISTWIYLDVVALSFVVFMVR